MPPYGLPPSAKICTISSLPSPSAASPVYARLVASVIGIDLPRRFLLLEDEGAAVLCDVELVVGRGGQHPPGVKTRVMVWGEVCSVETPLVPPPISTTLPSTSPPTLDPLVFLKATRLVECDELEMEQWREGVKAVQGLGAA
ncbi:hypothetical protein JCM10207_007180 [Rhodosporidiobolus poonsookiae]